MGACIYGSFCNHDSKHFSILRVSANALYDCYSRIVGQFFFPEKGYCVYMTSKIIHGCLQIQYGISLLVSTRHLTRSLRSLVSYRVKHSKINSIGFRGRWRFRSILVIHIRDILSFRLVLDIYALFQMVLDSLRVAVDVFEVVVGGC